MASTRGDGRVRLLWLTYYLGCDVFLGQLCERDPAEDGGDVVVQKRVVLMNGVVIEPRSMW